MKAIVITMLVVEAAMFLVAIFAAAFVPSTKGGRPAWAMIGISLVIVATAANGIGDRHSGQAGADMLQAGAMVLIGMAIMTALMGLRQRRGLT
jgi:hypothetical protein